MQIDIISDTVCPWCYIGKRRLERALAMRPDLPVDIGWRPYQLNPDMPEGGMDRRDYLAAKFGGTARAKDIYRNLVETGLQEGLAFDFDRIPKAPNTLASHRLIRWAGAAGVQNKVVETIFRRYFVEGADIGDVEVLIGIAEEAGMDSRLVRLYYQNGTDIQLVREEERLGRELGIQGVPFFIIDHKYAVSGAQDPSVFLQVFDLAAREAPAAGSATRTA